MKIKTKLNFSVGLLFLLIIILSVVSALYILRIKKDTENILQANYKSIEYSQKMLLSMDDTNYISNEKLNLFELNLNKQLKNITEVGEDEITNNVKIGFGNLMLNQSDEKIKKQIRQEILKIINLNMNAIKLKSDIAINTANTSYFWIAILATFCFLIAFNLLVNLPNNIANPLKELTASIQEIANKNYSQRVHFDNNNEFGDLAKSFNTMGEKLQEYNNSNVYKLSFEKKRLETLINNMHDPIIGLDIDEKILFVNNEALKILGLKSDEMIGKLVSKIAEKNDLMKSLSVIEINQNPMKIFADGKESYFEKENIKITVIPTGELKPIDIGNVIILRNISIFKELDFAKTNFIATVSHELKTPIAAIKMSLQLLEKPETGVINMEQKSLIDGIKDDSQRLLKITGELLELSQLETGNININIENCNPHEIVKFAIDAVKVQSEQKNISLVCELEENLPLIKADIEKTTWVLINFLTNAIEYSSENTKIIISLKKEDKQLFFQIIDTGKGIDDRYQTKIFDKYFQIPGSNKSGTGLGLAISKEFIEAQGGTIGVKSELGLGSRFYMKLNIA
jgi:signal transduction histidine kinase